MKLTVYPEFKRILTTGRLFCLLLAGLFSFANAQTETGSFTFDGRDRDYMVFLPQNFEANMPVVFNLHGYGYSNSTLWRKNYSLMNDVADTAGFKVSTLVSQKLNQGNHTFTFDGKNLSSGIYFYHLTTESYLEARKMILMK